MRKTLVMKAKYGEDESPYRSIEWSSLLNKILEESVNNVELSKAVSRFSFSFLEKQLAILSKAMQIVKDYQEIKYVEVGWFNGTLYDEYSSTISMTALAQARLNLLLAIPRAFISRLSITKEDKEILQNKFNGEIPEIHSIELLLDYYHQYVNHPLLTYRRHPYYDAMRNRLFKTPPEGPNSKVKFMKLVQARLAVLLADRSSQSNGIQVQEAIRVIFGNKGMPQEIVDSSKRAQSLRLYH